MSELINKPNNHATFLWKLLTSVSALALAAYTSSSAVVAEASFPPQVWIELNGELAQQSAPIESFSPAFLFVSPFGSNLDLEKPAETVWDKGAALSFRPEESDWVFSLGIRYGKSSRKEDRVGQPPTSNITHHNFSKSGDNAFQIFSAQNSESHAILDFRAGRDIGVGRFGSGASSILSVGIRFAQFNSHSYANIKSQPTNVDYYYHYNKFYASFDAKRKFSGIGPSLSWDASAIVIGNSTEGNVTLDWGANGAVLFGRQRMSAHSQVVEYPFYQVYKGAAVYHHTTPIDRKRNVTVPNIGGFTGVSWRYPHAKVTIGYRADFFFGAMDGGIDTAHRENVGFYGPFASVSVGIGG